jgi:hypothetical protein
MPIVAARVGMGSHDMLLVRMTAELLVNWQQQIYEDWHNRECCRFMQVTSATATT